MLLQVPEEYRKIENWKFLTAKIDRNISDLTSVLVNASLGLVRLAERVYFVVTS